MVHQDSHTHVAPPLPLSFVEEPANDGEGGLTGRLRMPDGMIYVFTAQAELEWRIVKMSRSTHVGAIIARGTTTCTNAYVGAGSFAWWLTEKESEHHALVRSDI